MWYESLNQFKLSLKTESCHDANFVTIQWWYHRVSLWRPTVPVNDDEVGISFLLMPLQWRHNGRDGVSNHQPHDCLLKLLFRRRSKKTSKLRVTGLCKWPVTRKVFPFDDVIMAAMEIVLMQALGLNKMAHILLTTCWNPLLWIYLDSDFTDICT